MGLADYRDLKVPTPLRQAAETLRRTGWTRGVLRSAEGALDIHGAILVAADCKPHHLDALTFPDVEHSVPPARQAQALGALTALDALTGDLPRWNDQPDRTIDEVLGLLENTADMIDIAVS